VLTLEKPSRWQKIAGGNDLLPRAFAERLGEKIRYESPVVKIAQTASDVAVTFRHKDRLETVRGDRLIVAIPLTMLRLIEIEPRFSDAKTAVIRNLKYESAARVLVQTKRRFWHESGLNGFGMGENFSEIWHGSFGQAGATRGILQSYLRGDYALDLMKLAERERLASSVRALEKLFPGASANYEKGFTKCWSEDPWTQGAWAQPGKDLEIIQKAEGRVHFAGEHASDMPSWMLGALRSAMRAVEEVKVQ
jgi:monoamine oxidase